MQPSLYIVTDCAPKNLLASGCTLIAKAFREEPEMNGLVVFLIATFVGLLWMGVLAPLIARFFGVPAKIFGFWRTEKLSKRDWIWFRGVLGFGIGMFLYRTTWDLLAWRTLGDNYSQLLILHRPFLQFMIWLAVGALFGIMTYPKVKTAPSKAQ